MSKPTTGKVSPKRYKCTRCGRVSTKSTNHWGDIYPRCEQYGTDDGCSWKNPTDPYPVHECLEKMPEEFDAPPKWKKVRLGDVVDIVQEKP